MQLRASLNSSRKNSLKHNSHEYMLESDRDNVFLYIKDNKFNIKNNPDLSFMEQHELDFYESRYSEGLELQNEKHIKAGHKKRVKTMKDYYENKNTHPDELILQVGNIDTKKPTKDEFLKIIATFTSRFYKKFDNIHFLDASLHFDEETPHAHFRYIYDYESEDGARYIEKTRACKAEGYDITDEEKRQIEKLKKAVNDSEGEEKKRNKKALDEYTREHNVIKYFTADCRTMFQDVCCEFGFDIVREPLPKRRKGESIKAFKERCERQTAQSTVDEIERAENALEKLKKAFEDEGEIQQAVFEELSRENERLTRENNELDRQIQEKKTMLDSLNKKINTNVKMSDQLNKEQQTFSQKQVAKLKSYENYNY